MHQQHPELKVESVGAPGLEGGITELEQYKTVLTPVSGCFK